LKGDTVDVRLTQFGHRLQELREAVGLSQKQLARKARLPVSTVALLENGSMEPGFFVMLAIAEVLGVDCAEFVSPTVADGVENHPAVRRKYKRPQKG
jgi:transcriptional regulator with XRE-family HTH domain